MALSQRLDLRQSQTLVMTPQLQQAIKLLQLSSLELADWIDREVEQNPLLDYEDAGAGVGAEPEAVEAPDGAGAASETGIDRLTREESMAAAGSEGPLDADWGNVWDPDGSGGSGPADWRGRGGSADFDDERGGLDETLAAGVSLRDHLLSQVNTGFHEAGDRLIGARLVEMLDERGWLAGDTGALAAQLGCPATRVEAVLARVQAFDPPGIFARGLAECLAIQLRERDRLDPAMQALLAHLDLLAQRDHAALCRIAGVDREDLAGMIAEIRALDPRPADAFERPVAATVVPDILMRQHPVEGWVVELNPETMPRVLVNQRYYAEISRSPLSRPERDYLADRLAQANWLVKSLHQRAGTIIKVAAEIVRRQDAFFIHGVSRLRPLILRDIAEAIGMHESTVSRVTTQKFMATPRGVFELKYFFTTALGGTGGAAPHSAEAVRFRIKALIEAEPPAEILSDDRIVEILRTDGIDIARRTVAKYREAMRIPSSVQRRREKAIGL